MPLKRIVFLVGLGVFVLTLLGLPARATYGAQTSADEPQYLLTALSIAEDGDLDISNQRYSGAYREFHEVLLPVQAELRPDGSRISPHSPLLPLYLSLPMRIGGWVGAKVAIAALAGILAGLLTWLGVIRFDAPPRTVAAVVSVLALSPPMAVYATQVYPEIAAALMVTVGIAALTGQPDRFTSVMLVSAVVALPWLAVKYVPIALVLAIAGMWKVRNRPPLVAGSLVALVGAGIGYLWFNQAVYGGLTPYAAGDFFVGGEFTAVGRAPDYPARSQRLVGLWVDRGFGIVAWQPAYLFSIPAIVWAARRRTPELVLLSTLVGTGWLVATFVAQTMHGWWWPGRQVVVIMPALILLLLHWSHRTGKAQRLLPLVGWAGAISFLVLVFEASTGRLTLIVDFVSTSNPIYRLWSPALPDYLNVTTLTWVLHIGWLIIFAVLGIFGWRSEPDLHAAGSSERKVA